jgi:OmpA-OmpF porin, OOP family
MIMKRSKIFLVLTLLCQITFAQEFSSTKKPSLLGFSANLTTFSTSLSGFGKADPGFSIMYWKGLTNKIDLSVRYNGLFSNYSKSSSKASEYINEMEASFHARPMNDNHILSPFITAGIGAGTYGKNVIAPYVPVGAGLQVNMYNESYIFLQGNYRFSLSKAKLDDNMFLSLGFTQALTEAKAAPVKELPTPPPAPVVVVDTDSDGVPDSTDACPAVAGLASLKGCPDKDNDGIADKDDKCPDVAGLAKYNGCPIPDTDKDGINDELDKCVDVAGIAKYGGCPIPDTDKDGVNDEMDKCLTLAGTAANDGCPEIKAEVKKRIEVAAKQIFFATGSAKLLAKSNKSLNEIAKILTEDANLKLDISGHTDNTGKSEKNKLLSENRAKGVYDYLVKKGVPEARLASAGFGQEQPIADNKKPAGRAKNRRVELNLHYN